VTFYDVIGELVGSALYLAIFRLENSVPPNVRELAGKRKVRA
jgi:hypothetical protein